MFIAINYNKRVEKLSFIDWLNLLKAEQNLKNPPKINRINYINGIKQ